MLWCEGAPWGPWQNGMFTECFQQIVLMTCASLVILVGGPYRLAQLRHSSFDQPYGKLQKLKIACCVILAGLPIAEMMVKIAYHSWYWFHIFSDVRDFLCWATCTVVVCLELKSGSKHYWALRLWWVLYFVGSCMVLQALRSMKSYYTGFEHLVAVLQFGFITLLTIVGLWAREGRVEEENTKKLIAKQRQFGTFSRLNLEGVGNPFEVANIFSKATLHWAHSIVSLGNLRPLESSDLWDLPLADTAENSCTRLELNWALQCEKPKPSLLKALWAIHGRMFLFAGVLQLTNEVLVALQPFIVYYLMLFLEDKNASFESGLILVGVLLCSCLTQTFTYHSAFFINNRIGNQIRASLTALIYRKASKMSPTERERFTMGEIINYQSVDTNRIVANIPFFHYAWTSPLQMIMVVVFLYWFLGYAVYAGIGFLVTIFFLNSRVVNKMVEYQIHLMGFRDKRIRIMSEMLSGIRLVKFFNWEKNFEARIQSLRQQEIHYLKKTSYAQVTLFFFLNNAPMLVAVICFSVYSLGSGLLTPELVFPALALIYALRAPFGYIPLVLTGIVEGRISMRRLEPFLLADEINENAIETGNEGDFAIQVNDASFSWVNDSPSTTLTDISFKIRKGELVAVVGTVGSGKSSILAALLGDIYKIRGRVLINGSIAYTPQQAWMQNATLRANILFGKQYYEDKYQQCIAACELLPDIQMLPNADSTEIGEKGINLSGGQKQRISLARAMYQGASIYLMDSPLSAVDAHVGRALFENVILGSLANTTRIFVTHQIDLLHRVDKVIVMRDGKIVDMGTYYELLAKGLTFTEFVTPQIAKNDSTEATETQQASKDGENGETGTASDGRLIEEEEKQEGTISAHVYKIYLKSAGYGVAILALFFYIGVAVGQVSIDGWLSLWTEAEDKEAKIYLIIYISLAVATVIVTILQSWALVYTTIRASIKLHNMLLERILHAPMSFFDTTPIGRILNRFARDLANIDSTLQQAIGGALTSAAISLSACAVISGVTPFVLILLLPITYLFFYLYIYYMNTSREVQRLESVSRSPIYALFSETLNGISTIRSYERVRDFVADNDNKIDRNSKALFVVNSITRWFMMRLELLSYMLVISAALFCIIERDSVSASLAGLSITYAMQFTGAFQYILDQYSIVENNLISVERVEEYSSMQQEASHDISEVNTPISWPTQGEISFQNVEVRYREGLELVLRGISATIKPHEKIGIVGRTGAGKSSLFLALYRLVEASRGSILIDQIDIAKLGLSKLRSAIAIVPQDPVLFTGTIRSNLDPFEKCDDNEIWEALTSVHLRSTIEALPDKLNSSVLEDGGNFSMGQRQLLCLARALISKSKILLMDEATASVDLDTDKIIQQMIREKFNDTTVLTIAHRINTILDYDRVMVLDQGRIAEMGSPSALANDENSIFCSLLREYIRTH